MVKTCSKVLCKNLKHTQWSSPSMKEIKVTGSISWRNYFKTKNVWTFLALLCSLFLEKRLKTLSDEKIEKGNSFLVSLFIFCFLNIIIRAFFRDINCTLRKRVILLEQDYALRNMYHLQSASENRQCNNNYSRRLPVQRTRILQKVLYFFFKSSTYSAKPCLFYSASFSCTLWIRGRGILPIMAYMGRLRPKGVPFPGFRYMKG